MSPNDLISIFAASLPADREFPEFPDIQAVGELIEAVDWNEEHPNAARLTDEVSQIVRRVNDRRYGRRP